MVSSNLAKSLHHIHCDQHDRLCAARCNMVTGTRLVVDLGIALAMLRRGRIQYNTACRASRFQCFDSESEEESDDSTAIAMRIRAKADSLRQGQQRGRNNALQSM